MAKSKGIWLFSLLTAACILALVLWPVRTLILESENSVPVLLMVKPGETITLEYIHSIYHVRQQEVYEPVGTNLVLRSMFFGDMSAALYYDSYSRYALEPQPGGGYIIRGLNLGYSAISFAMGHGTQYNMYIGTTQSVDLDKSFKNFTFLTVRTEVMPRGKFIFRRLRNGNR